jgi:hypothetical protein
MRRDGRLLSVVGEHGDGTPPRGEKEKAWSSRTSVTLPAIFRVWVVTGRVLAGLYAVRTAQRTEISAPEGPRTPDCFPHRIRSSHAATRLTRMSQVEAIPACPLWHRRRREIWISVWDGRCGWQHCLTATLGNRCALLGSNHRRSCGRVAAEDPDSAPILLRRATPAVAGRKSWCPTVLNPHACSGAGASCEAPQPNLLRQSDRSIRFNQRGAFPATSKAAPGEMSETKSRKHLLTPGPLT